MNWKIGRPMLSGCLGSIVAAAIATVVTLLFAGTTPSGNAAPASKEALEEIYILRSIREPHEPVAGWCSSGRTGFEPFPTDAERFFSFWSLELQPDGKVADTKRKRAAELRGCFGATSEPARQNFYAEIELGSISFRGNGECLAVGIDFPDTGLFPVRCQLILSGLPTTYVGGLLTTNTITSKARFGGDTDPAGYTQASIATIRLWKSK
ncbi:hypothetical protein [Hyphomicrobium sp.]|uniref:hypothetical protein n=1 Tax=Hyphomicrobium sp. TaxID=82 RepID=UPI0025BAE43F|nr:hypothetical protein [Hyphomicrobium sp.]MCC7254115.1 hypothetical protein [Hyphomicrobium sp.]